MSLTFDDADRILILYLSFLHCDTHVFGSDLPRILVLFIVRDVLVTDDRALQRLGSADKAINITPPIAHSFLLHAVVADMLRWPLLRRASKLRHQVPGVTRLGEFLIL